MVPVTAVADDEVGGALERLERGRDAEVPAASRHVPAAVADLNDRVLADQAPAGGLVDRLDEGVEMRGADGDEDHAITLPAKRTRRLEARRGHCT